MQMQVRNEPSPNLPGLGKTIFAASACETRFGDDIQYAMRNRWVCILYDSVKLRCIDGPLWLTNSRRRSYQQPCQPLLYDGVPQVSQTTDNEHTETEQNAAASCNRKGMLIE